MSDETNLFTIPYSVGAQFIAPLHYMEERTQ